MNTQPNSQLAKKLAIKKQSIVVLSAPPGRTAIPNLGLLNQGRNATQLLIANSPTLDCAIV